VLSRVCPILFSRVFNSSQPPGDDVSAPPKPGVSFFSRICPRRVTISPHPEGYLCTFLSKGHLPCADLSKSSIVGSPSGLLGERSSADTGISPGSANDHPPLTTIQPFIYHKTRLMPSHENTPFIPPLTFTPSPQPSAVPPLLPSQPAAANTPPWANQPTTPAHFPHYGSPYAGTPFVPPNIINSPGYMPGSYHPAPTHLPPAAGAPPPAGVSSDWHGYPPAAAAGPPPWANTWAVPPTGYNTFTQPLSPLLYPDGTPWSGAVPPSVLTAAGFGLGAPMHGTWPPGYGPPGSVPASAVPTAPQRPPPELDGPRNRRGLGEDLPIRHFAAGRHCTLQSPLFCNH
jgi:hypothetical protein